MTAGKLDGSFRLGSTGIITPGVLGGDRTDPAPGPVTSVTKTGGNSKVTITWSAPTTGGVATSVVIYRSLTNAISSSPLATVSISPGQYVDSSVVNNQTYYYWLVSANSDGNGPAVATGLVHSRSAPAPYGDNTALLIGLIVLIIVVFLFSVIIRRRRKRP